jgi:hypothetical protein
MSELLTFHNDPKVKEFYLSRVQAHYDADEIIKDKYWENGKGCAVGRTLHSSDHSDYETELGVPKWVAKLEDTIFEGLPNEEAKEFPVRFIRDTPIGVDLSQIKIPFLIIVVESVIDKFDHDKFPYVKKAIDNVLSLLKNDNITKEALKATIMASALAAARGAYRFGFVVNDAAWKAAAAAAAAAADDDDDDDNVAWATSRAVAWATSRASAAAGVATYTYFADRLIELISEIKPK